MVHRCIVGGCGNTDLDDIGMHHFPKDRKIRDKWGCFVNTTRKRM